MDVLIDVTMETSFDGVQSPALKRSLERHRVSSSSHVAEHRRRASIAHALTTIESGAYAAPAAQVAPQHDESVPRPNRKFSFSAAQRVGAPSIAPGPASQPARAPPKREESMSLDGFKDGVSSWQHQNRAGSLSPLQHADSSGVPDVGAPRAMSPLVAFMLARRQGPLDVGRLKTAVSGRRRIAPATELNPSETLEAAAVFHPVCPPRLLGIDASRAELAPSLACLSTTNIYECARVCVLQTTLLFRSSFIENAFKQERLFSSLLTMAAILALTTLTQIVIGVRLQGVLFLSG